LLQVGPLPGGDGNAERHRSGHASSVSHPRQSKAAPGLFRHPLASDVDTDPARREGTKFCGGRLTSRGKGTYRGRPRGLRGVAAPVRAFISRDEDDLAARVAGLDDAVGFRRVFGRGRPLRPGVRRWLPAHPAAGGGRRPRPARHRHRSALTRGDGIPWLAARRSGCPGVASALPRHVDSTLLACRTSVGGHVSRISCRITQQVPAGAVTTFSTKGFKGAPSARRA
jgi:hypothetical protein